MTRMPFWEEDESVPEFSTFRDPYEAQEDYDLSQTDRVARLKLLGIERQCVRCGYIAKEYPIWPWLFDENKSYCTETCRAASHRQGRQRKFLRGLL